MYTQHMFSPLTSTLEKLGKLAPYILGGERPFVLIVSARFISDNPLKLITWKDKSMMSHSYAFSQVYHRMPMPTCQAQTSCLQGAVHTPLHVLPLYACAPFSTSPKHAV